VALGWAHSARFLVTASQLDQLPAPGLPEIAFVGRSNAGKSSAINALAQHRRLAFSSRMPGRTQHINLFELGPKAAPDALFADLPGYGYAAVERGAKLRWQRVMAEYLRQRRSLAGIVLLVDARLGLTDLDQRLLALVTPRLAPGAEGGVRLLLLLTKADKLNRRNRQAALTRCQEALQGVAAQAGDGCDIGVSLFSALSREGLADVAEVLHGWRHSEVPAAVPLPESA
jgi:GTP-binding protein